MQPQPSETIRREVVSSGFTRIELLVVIGTIALLSLMLLPALAASTSERAIRTACLNNLRQLSIEMTVYAGNNGDKLLPALSVTSSTFNQVALSGISGTTATNLGLLPTNSASIWTCPNRPGLPFYDPAPGGGTAQWDIGYQYFGGITNWVNFVFPSGTPSRSPVMLSQSQPYWCLAADVIFNDGVRWGDQPVGGGPYAYTNLPPHHNSDSLSPQGGNEVFVDGSARWIPVEKMRMLTSWAAVFGNRNFYFYQDPKDFPPLLIAHLSTGPMVPPP